MKRLFCICACLCVLCSVFPAFAVEDQGDNTPPSWLFPDGATGGTEEPSSGSDPDPAPQPPPQEVPKDTVESVGSTDDEQDIFVDVSTLTPVGKYFADEDGNLYDSDGKQAGLVPARDYAADDTVSDDVLASADILTDLEALLAIKDVVDGIASDPSIRSVSDLRATDGEVAVLSGLKALVVSIFGEYTPVTTTTVVTETIGNDVTTTLIDTVADGAAGVDYEWCAGVLLFAVLLYCLLRLLGGVFK